VADPAEQLKLLMELLGRINKDASPDAHVLLLATLAHAKLVFGDPEGTKTDIDAAWAVLDNLSSVENAVNAAYYSVAADYYKVRVAPYVGRWRLLTAEQAKAEYGPYYRNSLLYLACIDSVADIAPEERLLRAHDLGIAALLGESIYNFGELVRREFVFWYF